MERSNLSISLLKLLISETSTSRLGVSLQIRAMEKNKVNAMLRYLMMMIFEVETEDFILGHIICHLYCREDMHFLALCCYDRM